MYLESGALDHSAILTELIKVEKIYQLLFFKNIYKKNLAERSFDLRTSGLWAQHASTAPLCYQYCGCSKKYVHHRNTFPNFLLQYWTKIICQKWDSNPRPQKWTAT